jgi:hypothetical protein
LANDGIDATGKKLLEEMGCVVLTDKVKQDELGTHTSTIKGFPGFS